MILYKKRSTLYPHYEEGAPSFALSAFLVFALGAKGGLYSPRLTLAIYSVSLAQQISRFLRVVRVQNHISRRAWLAGFAVLIALAKILPLRLFSQSKPQPQKNRNPASGPKDAIADKVKDIVVEQLGVDQRAVVPTARFVEDLGADSLDQVELIMAFEEAFDLEIPDDACPKLKTVQGAIDYIKAHMKHAKEPAKPAAPAKK
jgi:acyl carrier protein